MRFGNPIVEVAGTTLMDDEGPVPMWIDLHRVRDGVIRCRGHVLGEGDACADIVIDEALRHLVGPGADGPGPQPVGGDRMAAGIERTLGGLLFPGPVKELFEAAVGLRRPVEVRLRAHDALDALPWESAQFRLTGSENLTLNTVERTSGGWIALLRQVDVVRPGVVDPDVVGAVFVQIGPSGTDPREARLVIGRLKEHRHPTHAVFASDLRTLDTFLPEHGSSATAIRAALVYVAGHLGGEAGRRHITFSSGGISYESLENRLRTARARIAVLNVCETADRLGGAPSWIERLCQQGAVEAAVGLKGRIDGIDESHLVAEPLVSVLAQGGSVGAAVHAVRTVFHRPEIVVAATGEHRPVTIMAGPRRRRRRWAPRTARYEAPVAVTLAADGEGAVVVASHSVVSVAVAYGLPPPAAAGSGRTWATRAAGEAAALFGVEPPSDVQVMHEPIKAGFEDVWELSFTAAAVGAVAELAGGVSASERAEAVLRTDARWSASAPALRRIVDDRSFPIHVSREGTVTPAPLGENLELVILDHLVAHKASPVPSHGTVVPLGALGTLMGNELQAVLKPAVEAWVRGIRTESTFRLVKDWRGDAGFVAPTVTPSGHLAGMFMRGEGEGAARRLKPSRGTSLRWVVLPLVSR